MVSVGAAYLATRGSEYWLQPNGRHAGHLVWQSLPRCRKPTGIQDRSARVSRSRRIIYDLFDGHHHRGSFSLVAHDLTGDQRNESNRTWRATSWTSGSFERRDWTDLVIDRGTGVEPMTFPAG